MVKYVILKKEYNYSNKLVKIVARIYRKRTFARKYKAIWSNFCGNIERQILEINSKSKYYRPIAKRIKEEQMQIQKELTREEKRQQCKCKEKCKSEFQCGIL